MKGFQFTIILNTINIIGLTILLLLVFMSFKSFASISTSSHHQDKQKVPSPSFNSATRNNEPTKLTVSSQPIMKQSSEHNDKNSNRQNDLLQHDNDMLKARLKQQEQVRQSAIKAKQKKHKKELERLERTYFPLPGSTRVTSSRRRDERKSSPSSFNSATTTNLTRNDVASQQLGQHNDDKNSNGRDESPNRERDIQKARLKQQEQVRQNAIKAKQKKHKKELERLERSYFPLPKANHH